MGTLWLVAGETGHFNREHFAFEEGNVRRHGAAHDPEPTAVAHRGPRNPPGGKPNRPPRGRWQPKTKFEMVRPGLTAR